MAPILDGSERVIAFNAKLPIFQLYHKENYKLHLITDTLDRIAILPVPPQVYTFTDFCWIWKKGYLSKYALNFFFLWNFLDNLNQTWQE
jgi:hypothetical protein